MYLIFLGLLLVLNPNPLLKIFSFPQTNEVWIRVTGMLLFFIGIYYFISARYELYPIIWASILLRGAVIFFFIGFVLLHLAPVQLLIFGLIDLLFALWTWLSFLKSKQGIS